MPVQVIWQNRTSFKVQLNDIRKHLNSVLLAQGYPGTLNIEVVIVDDEEIKKLNQKYLNQNRPTDVLSFSADQAPHSQDAVQDLLGSIIISAETAATQAKDAGITLLDEIKMLSSHGLLHLLNYHHV